MAFDLTVFRASFFDDYFLPWPHFWMDREELFLHITFITFYIVASLSRVLHIYVHERTFTGTIYAVFKSKNNSISSFASEYKQNSKPHKPFACFEHIIHERTKLCIVSTKYMIFNNICTVSQTPYLHYPPPLRFKKKSKGGGKGGDKAVTI